MTIHKHFCRICGSRADHQNLCDQPSCLRQARQVEVIKQDMSRLGWVATKEMVLEHAKTQIPILRLAGKMTREEERAVTFLMTEIRASLFDDVTTIVNNHPHAAKLLKLPLIKLLTPKPPPPVVYYGDTDSVGTDAPLGTPMEELEKAFGGRTYDFRSFYPVLHAPDLLPHFTHTSSHPKSLLERQMDANAKRLEANAAYGKQADIQRAQKGKP